MRGDGSRTGRQLVEKAKKGVPRISFVVAACSEAVCSNTVYSEVVCSEAVCSEAVCSGIVNVQRASGSSANDPARVFKSRAS